MRRGEAAYKSYSIFAKEMGKMSEKRRGMASFMAGLILFALLFVGAAYLISVVLTNYFSLLTEGERAIPISSEVGGAVFVIDPGHGGEDGGSSSGEVLEKDLNLEVSRDVFYLCELFGVPAKITREDDRALYDLYGELEDYSGKKKAYDLKSRVRFAKEEGDVYVGIHMNKFPVAKYRGLQVYYSPNDAASEEFAQMIQASAREHIDPENDREIKRAGSSIYVLDRLEIPAVLVECGFISCPEELALLLDPGYRLKVAGCVVSAAMNFDEGRASLD